MLQYGEAWYKYFLKNEATIRPAVLDTIIRILSCGKLIRGYKIYCCIKDGCMHIKKVPFGCNCRFCPTCGKRLTDHWIEKQNALLPQTDWQHITFTMPGDFWDFFKDYRELLCMIAKIAADIIQKIAKQNGITVGIFTALHTFGHDLKWNTHVHMSVTLGGITEDNKWKKIRFNKTVVMKMWRYAIVDLLRKTGKDGNIEVCNQLLNHNYKKDWFVHFSEPIDNPQHAIAYLGRYIKRPPISQSKLKHYDGSSVSFEYLDRKDNQYKTATYSSDDFMERFTQHIPDKGFRMIRYYGFLANRVRGKLLPIVYKLVDHIVKEVKITDWATMFLESFKVDPLKCPLCGSRMALVGTVFGLSNKQLGIYHEALAKREIIRMPN
jgi:hypothetical protein